MEEMKIDARTRELWRSNSRLVFTTLSMVYLLGA
jgi:hypothetical protein